MSSKTLCVKLTEHVGNPRAATAVLVITGCISASWLRCYDSRPGSCATYYTTATANSTTLQQAPIKCCRKPHPCNITCTPNIQHFTYVRLVNLQQGHARFVMPMPMQCSLYAADASHTTALPPTAQSEIILKQTSSRHLNCIWLVHLQHGYARLDPTRMQCSGARQHLCQAL
jgi:hypothetical protein